MGVKPNIELHIEELVLHGIPVGDRDSIRATVEAELSRLFVQDGIPQGLSKTLELPRIQGATICLTPNLQAEEFGSHIASAIYGSLPQ